MCATVTDFDLFTRSADIFQYFNNVINIDLLTIHIYSFSNALIDIEGFGNVAI